MGRLDGSVVVGWWFSEGPWRPVNGAYESMRRTEQQAEMFAGTR